MSRFHLLKSRAGDALASLLLLLLAILVYHWASDFPQRKGDALGPDFFPKILAVVLGLLAGLMMVEPLLMKKPPQAEAGKDYRLTTFVAALIFVYVLVLPWAGFLVSTILFLTTTIYSLRRKHFLRIAILSALFSASIYLVFKMVLKVPLL